MIYDSRYRLRYPGYVRSQADMSQHLDALNSLEAAKKASTNHAADMQKDAEEFQQHYDDVQRRLQLVTSSDDAEEAAKRLTGPMEKLRRVELARQYVDLLKTVGTF